MISITGADGTSGTAGATTTSGSGRWSRSIWRVPHSGQKFAPASMRLPHAVQCESVLGSRVSATVQDCPPGTPFNQIRAQSGRKTLLSVGAARLVVALGVALGVDDVEV